MYVIYFLENNFKLSIELEDYLDEDKFNNYVIFLKYIYIMYEENKFWNIPYKRIDEIIMWFEYHDYDYRIMPEAQIEFKNFKENNFKREYKFNRIKQFDLDVYSEEVILYNYLKEGCNWGIKRNRGYIADDPGLGKTIESIGLFSQLYKENEIDGIFIIVRIGTSYNWKKEILKFSNIFKEEDIEIIFNDNKIRPFEENKNKKIIIISNHLLGYVFASYRKDYDKIKRKLSKIRWNKSYVNILEKWNKNSLVLIIDEAHEFKNFDSLRSKSLQAHKHFFEYRFNLSATPAINRFEDYWNQFNILDESIIPYSKNAFKIYIAKELGDKYSNYTIKEYNYKNIKEIKTRISPFIIQRLKKDLSEVKTKQFIKPIYLEMSKKHQKLYDIFIDYTISELKKEYDFIDLNLIFEKYFAYILQIIDNPLLLEGKINDEKFNKLLNSWKITDDPRFIYTKSALKTYIKDFDEKVILFDNHPKTLDLLYEQFKEYNPIIVHGHTKDNEKTKQEKQDLFNDKNSKYKLFLLSSQIGGASWNLEKACRRELFYILPYDTTITRQAFDRIYRITSKFDSIIEMLIIDKSIDNLRYLKNVKRIEINDNLLRKNLSEDEIKSLFLGILNTNN